MRQWVESQMPACRSARQLRMRCFDPGCGKTLSQGLVLHVSESARRLAELLERRFDLESNKLFPERQQVDCPRHECVGLGYLGFETVMCFICEHQWPASRAQKAPFCDFVQDLPETVKPCPRCGVLIEKDGGCDHITCQCGYDFLWSSLAMWEP